MTPTFQPRLAILPAPQIALWPELREVPSNFTLYGGTAVALYLGHRQSVDFDFFVFQDIEPDELLESLPFLRHASTLQKGRNTLTVLVERGGPVKLSFFGVPRLGRVQQTLRTADTGLGVASLLDLAATKASVVQVRAEAKDYIDLDALHTLGSIDLSQALGAATAIYGPGFNPQLTLKALSFYEDGNLHEVPAAARERLAQAARSVDLDSLPRFHCTVDP